MKIPSITLFSALLVAVGLSMGSAKAFDPFFGTPFEGLWQAAIDGVDADDKAWKSKEKFDGKTTVTQTGTSFDAKIQAKGKDGTESVEIVITLNADGTGSCVMNGTTVAGKAGKARAPQPGARFRIRSKAAGTWQLVGGLRTVMVFTGKTNGVKTVVNVVMDLSPQGEFTLDVKTKLAKNPLLKKLAFKFAGKRK